MDNYQLIVNGVSIPLSEKVASAIALNLSITDISEADKRKSDYSKDFTLPSSKELNKEFAFAFEIDVDLNDTSFNPANKIDCELIVNGSTQIDGHIRLKNIIKLGEGDYEYKVNIFGRLSNLMTDIGEGLIEDIDFSDLDHDWTKANEVNSWATSYQLNGAPQAFSLGSGYVYPMIDYGFDNDEERYSVDELYPAIFQREYLLRMFNDAGYTWNSTFLDSTYFKSRIIPYSGGIPGLTVAQVEQRRVVGQYSTPIGYNPSPTTTTTVDNLTLTPVVDALSQINTDEIIVSQRGWYDITFETNFNAEFVHPDLGVPVVLYGGIRVIQDILVNRGSGAVVEHQKQSIVTADGSFTADYTTDINSLPNNPEYINGGSITGSVNLNNPSSVMIGTKQQILLNPADVITYKVKFFFQGNGNQTQIFQQVADPTIFYNNPLNLTFNIQALDLRLIQQGGRSLSEGNALDMATLIPKDIKKKDFLISIIREHNLFIEPDKDNPTQLNIEPRDDYYGSTVTNWSDKLDLSNPVEFDMIASNKYNKLIFTGKEDKDYYNELYDETYNEVYGSRTIEIDNDFTSATKTIKTIFSPTPSVGSLANDRVVPEIFKADNNGNKTVVKGNIRSLYYGGLKACNTGWTLESILAADEVFVTYPYCGHLDDPYSPSLSLNWGLPQEYYFSNYHNTMTITNNGLFNKYYYKTINEITDANSRTVTAYFNLSRYDIEQLEFSNLYYFDRAYFRLQQVVDYRVVGTQVTKCIFSLTDDLPEFSATTVIGNGGSGLIGLESLPAFNQQQVALNGNTFNALNGSVEGSNNSVDPQVKNFNVVGNNNTLLGDIENVFIVGDGHAVRESNTTIIDGNVTIEGVDINGEGAVETIAVDTTLEESVQTYLVDTSSANILVTLPSGVKEGKIFRVKKMSAANGLTVDTFESETIDGSASVSWTTLNNSFSFQFDGTNYNII